MYIIRISFLEGHPIPAGGSVTSSIEKSGLIFVIAYTKAVLGLWDLCILYGYLLYIMFGAFRHTVRRTHVEKVSQLSVS